jgi:hypothetical protein
MNDDNEYTTYSHFDIEDNHVGLQQRQRATIRTQSRQQQ